MNRKELDSFAAHYGLSPRAVAWALSLTSPRPSPSDVERFVVRVLHLAGVLSIAAGVVFFVAANWEVLAVVGRFVLVEAVLVAAVAVALWRPPPDAVGRFALLFAFIVSGALFALYGQTYQTGADVYELFLNWALLGALFAVAAQWSVVWAAWALVLNVALWLYSAAGPQAGLMWTMFALWGDDPSVLLVIPLLVDVALWAVTVGLEATRWSALAPRWLGRFVLSCAVGVGTTSGMIVVFREDGPGTGLLVPLLVFGLVAAHTLHRREDVFPLAAIVGSLILLSTAWLAEASSFGDSGVFFLLAAWLIGTSTVCGRYLMRLVRSWAGAESAAESGEESGPEPGQESAAESVA